jgi:Ca2+-binding RTX toxin-like protein
MASYAFRTITADQASAILPTDSLSLGDIPATSVTVLYNPSSITIIAAGRTIDFPLAVSDLSVAGNLTGVDGSRLYIGGAGNDTVSLVRTGFDDPRHNALFGGTGDDNLDGGGLGLLQGNQGNDTLAGGSTIYGGQDNDLIHASGFAQGNKGEDSLQGAGGTDTLLGGQGGDTIDGGGGPDFLNGNLGDDHITGAGQLFGEGGNDELYLSSSMTSSTLDGGAGDDYFSVLGLGAPARILGGDGNDYVLSTAGSGSESIDGGAGNDTVNSVVAGSETVIGGTGDDNLYLGKVGTKSVDGGDGDDRIELRGGYGQVFGGAGDDTVMMLFTSDFSTVSGGDGNDMLSAPGFVTLDGGAGDDTLISGWMTGGSGADRFAMSWIGDANAPQGGRVLDWSANDKVLIPQNVDHGHILYSEATAASFGAACALFQQSGYGDHVMAIQVGADVIVFAAANSNPDPDLIEIDAVVLVGRTLADIDATKLA